MGNINKRGNILPLIAIIYQSIRKKERKNKLNLFPYLYCPWFHAYVKYKVVLLFKFACKSGVCTQYMNIELTIVRKTLACLDSVIYAFKWS